MDAKCRKLTAPWVRERAATVPDIELCGFYEDFEKAGSDGVLPPGVYTLQVCVALHLPDRQLAVIQCRSSETLD